MPVSLIIPKPKVVSGFELGQVYRNLREQASWYGSGLFY